MEQNTTNTVLAAVGNKLNAGGLSTSAFGIILSNEFAVGVGLIVAIGGFCINWYYKRKEYSLKEKETMQRLKYEELKYEQLQEEVTVNSKAGKHE